MKWRIAINGYGRIGQSVLRALYQSPLFAEMEIVAINELADIKTIAYLTRYDTTHGRFPEGVSVVDEHTLKVGSTDVRILHHELIDDLPWSALDVDIVFECTGRYTTRAAGEQHLLAGAKKVLFSNPAEASVDKTIVYGVNHETLVAEDQIVSNASCTTNALVPILKELDACFGIEYGTTTTIHSAMNDQPTIDAYHHADLRLTRSAMQNIVPVDTALAIGVERLLPAMANKLTAVAVRVPTVNVSAIDLSVHLTQSVSVDAVNNCFAAAAHHVDGKVIAYTEDPLASSDFNQDTHSCIIDGSQTRVSGERLLKCFIWFDNEWAFANRMLDVSAYWLRKSE